MAAPAFQAWGSYAVRLTADAAAPPGVPASVAQGDILLLAIEDQATDTTTGLPTVSGGTETWTQHPASPQASGGATRLSLYWARASTASPTMPDIGGGTNHTFSRVARFTGGTTSGNPWVGSEYNSSTNIAANAVVGGFSIGGPDRLVVWIVSTGYNGTNAARFSGWANTDLTSVTEIHDQTDTIGGGGGFGAMTGVRAASGTIGASSATEAFSGHATIILALAPPQASAYAITASPGSYAVSGDSAGTLATRAISAISASYSLTGVAATLQKALQIVASPGSFAISGDSAEVLTTRVISAASGSYALSGFLASIVSDRVIWATSGSYTLTGTAISALAGRVLSASPGVHAISGWDAELLKTGGPLTDYELSVDPGVFAITGNLAGVVAGRIVSATPGSFTVSGVMANLLTTRSMTASPGAFNLSGLAAAIVAGRIVVASPGGYIVTGVQAQLLAAKMLSANPAGYVLSGVDAILFYDDQTESPTCLLLLLGAGE